ncbi:MAG: hypothetical protein NVS4B3_22370 [Gemmatimonadaceae bacterium]
MPLPQRLRDELGRQRRAEHVEAARDTLRDYAWSAARCAGWGAVGICLILLSAHVTSATYGRIAFYAGLALGNGGILFTLLATYRRGEARGDW